MPAIAYRSRSSPARALIATTMSLPRMLVGGSSGTALNPRASILSAWKRSMAKATVVPGCHQSAGERKHGQIVAVGTEQVDEDSHQSYPSKVSRYPQRSDITVLSTPRQSLRCSGAGRCPRGSTAPNRGSLMQPVSPQRSVVLPLVHTGVCVTIVCMAQVDRLSVTMPPEVGAAVRDAAARQGTSVSNWLTAAATQRLRNELLGAAMDHWEAEQGPFTDEELNAAAAALRTPRRRGAA